MIGELLDLRYELIEQLSTSAIFESFRARDRVRNADVCVRVVRQPFASEPQFINALRNVTERTRLLDHPNIAKVYEIAQHEQTIFVVCELVKGSDLAEKIRRVAPFSPPVACELAIGILEALEHAALRGLVHGDLCSDHVVTTLEGRVAVIDFGLWECYGASGSAAAMVLSRMAPYLAPELIEGDLPSTASDVYAVGVILFELLTGRLPFAGQTPASTLTKHTTQAVPSVRHLNAAVPAVLDQIVQKALSKDKAERYKTPGEMLAHLRALRDALRFGKQLAWPIAGEEPAPGSGSGKTLGNLAHAEARTNVPSSQPVFAAKKEPKVKVRQVRDDDVPAWLKATVYVLSGMAAMFVVGWIVLNVTKKREIEVPNFVGMTLAEAREKSRVGGIKLVIVGEEYSDKFPQPDTIIEMNPAPKTHVREGAYVSVWRSLGGTQVNVPDLKGVDKAEAKRRLQAAGLKVSQNEQQRPSREFSEGQVIETEPKAGERVDRNTSIDLIVSSGRASAPSPDREEDTPENTWRLRFKVKDSDTEVMVRVEMTDASDEKQIVYEAPHPGGDYVDISDIKGKGKLATFRIYFDDYLWRTIRKSGEK